MLARDREFYKHRCRLALGRREGGSHGGSIDPSSSRTGREPAARQVDADERAVELVVAGQSGAARSRGIRDDHVRALDVQLESRRRKGRAGGPRPGASLWRDRAVARRHVGVPYRQHLRRGRVLLLSAPSGSPSGRCNVFYAKSIGGNAGHAVGVYLWAWAIFTAYMTVAALRVSGAVLLVFALLTITFILLAIGAVGPHTTVTHWGGYLGLATAAAAWYASFAMVTNSTFKRTVLPVMPLSEIGRVRSPWATQCRGRSRNARRPGRREARTWRPTRHARRAAGPDARGGALRAPRRVPRARAAERSRRLRAGGARSAGWWVEQAEQLDWFEPWEQVLDDSNPPFYKWFVGGRLNASHNCLDRHVAAGRGERVALHWHGEEGERARHHLRRAAGGGASASPTR